MLPSNLSQFLPPQRVAFLNVYQDEARAPVWEQALFVVWFTALFLPLPDFTLIRYGCIALMLGLFALNYSDTVPTLLKSWPLLLYPLFGVLSVFWSNYPADALRSAILLVLTPILLVLIATRLRPTQFLRVMMLAGTLAALYCVPYFSTLSEGGPFPQKNLLAYQMMIATLICVATALNSGELPVFRLIACASAPLAFVIQLNADSATSLVLAVVGAAALVGVKLFWSSAATVAHLRSFLLILFASILLLVLVGILSAPYNTFISDFLALVGKDATLTGRTGIWRGAELVSAQHPWFGVGLEGFWQYNTGLAQTLNEVNYTPAGTNISFHSAFWEVRVHLGFVGLAFFILTIVWAGIRTVRLWLRDGSIINSAFLLFYCIILVTCFTESYPSLSSSTIVTVFYIGALAAFDVGGRKLVGQARVVEQVD